MHANQLQKTLIEDFWNKFGGWKPSNHGFGFPAKDKLDEIKRMAGIKIPYKKQTARAHRREVFNEVKGTLCRQKIGSPCFVCGKSGFARHHLIQLQNGGINSRRNLLILCDPCHALVHPWLQTC